MKRIILVFAIVATLIGLSLQNVPPIVTFFLAAFLTLIYSIWQYIEDAKNLLKMLKNTKDNIYILELNPVTKSEPYLSRFADNKNIIIDYGTSNTIYDVAAKYERLLKASGNHCFIDDEKRDKLKFLEIPEMDETEQVKIVVLKHKYGSRRLENYKEYETYCNDFMTNDIQDCHGTMEQTDNKHYKKTFFSV